MLDEWEMFLQVVSKLSQPYMFALHADHSNSDMATFLRDKTTAACDCFSEAVGFLVLQICYHCFAE